MNIQDWIIVHNGEMEKQYKAQKQLKLMAEKCSRRDKSYAKIYK